MINADPHAATYNRSAVSLRAPGTAWSPLGCRYVNTQCGSAGTSVRAQAAAAACDSAVTSAMLSASAAQATAQPRCSASLPLLSPSLPHSPAHPPPHPPQSGMESLISILACVLTSLLVVTLLVRTTLKQHTWLYDHGPLSGDGPLSIYVADVPDKFVVGTFGRGPEESNLQYGHTAFGSLLSVEHEMWASPWHSVTAWYTEQIKTSPLRTYDAASADIIFVPAILDQHNPRLHDQFILEVDQFLPYLHTKPHLLVLTHAPGWYSSALLRHNNSQNFVFVSWGDPLTGWPPNIIHSPAFSFVHWSRGSKQLQTREQHFDAEGIEQLKTRLVVETFRVRDFPDRFAVFEDCKAAPENCTHLDWNSWADALPMYEALRSAWYSTHPKGDFLMRQTLCDTLLADAVPVFFHAEYIDSVPFTDVLNYTRIAVYIPEHEIVAPKRTNLIHRLAKDFDREEALSRIEYIHNIRHLFQYMQNPEHELIRWDLRATIDPGDDAFTFTLKSVLRNMCRRRWRTEKCGVVDRVTAAQTHVMWKFGRASRIRLGALTRHAPSARPLEGSGARTDSEHMVRVSAAGRRQLRHSSARQHTAVGSRRSSLRQLQDPDAAARA